MAQYTSPRITKASRTASHLFMTRNVALEPRPTSEARRVLPSVRWQTSAQARVRLHCKLPPPKCSLNDSLADKHKQLILRHDCAFAKHAERGSRQRANGAQVVASAAAHLALLHP